MCSALGALDSDVAILPVSISMMNTILPLTDVGWTGRSAHTLDDTIAAYHIAKTPGAVPAELPRIVILTEYRIPDIILRSWEFTNTEYRIIFVPGN